jgi:hypothetical protein
MSRKILTSGLAVLDRVRLNSIREAGDERVQQLGAGSVAFLLVPHDGEHVLLHEAEEKV